MPGMKRRNSSDVDEDGSSSKRTRSSTECSQSSIDDNVTEGDEDVFGSEELNGLNVDETNSEETLSSNEEMPSTSGVSSIDPIRGFEYLEHPADILLHAWGSTDEEAMGALVESLYGVLTERDEIKEVYSYEMEAEGDTDDVLIFNTLQEALYAFQAEPYFVGHRVEVIGLKKNDDGHMQSIQMKAWGESFEIGKHVQKSDIKAPTYSNMQIRRDKDRVDLYVVVDV